MQQFWKNERVRTLSLNVLIGVLLIGIFLQCGVFLYRYSKIRAADGEIPFNMRMLSVSGQDDSGSLNPDLLLPAEIAVSREGSARAVLNSAAVMRDLYEEMAGTITACLAASPAKGTDALWALTVTSPDVIYIRYHDELPYQIVHAFSAAALGTEEYVRNAADVGVAELCIRQSGGKATAVVRSSDGVYLFTASAAAASVDYYAYAQLYPDVFYPCTLNRTEAGSAILLTERVTAREMLTETGIPGWIAENQPHFRSWLRSLQFNPDKLNYHTEPDGTTVYVESHGILWCGPDRMQYTASEDGGIDVEEFYTPGGTDVYVYLHAASAWIAEVAAMSLQYTGGDASPLLTSVTADGQSVTLHFGLYMDNLPVYYDGMRDAISLTFTGDVVTEILWQPVLVTRQLTEKKTFFASWSRTVLGTDDVKLAYRAGADRQIISAEWIAHREGEG